MLLSFIPAATSHALHLVFAALQRVVTELRAGWQKASARSSLRRAAAVTLHLYSCGAVTSHYVSSAQAGNWEVWEAYTKSSRLITGSKTH